MAAAGKVAEHCWEWLGHLACMPNHCIPSKPCSAGYLSPIQEIKVVETFMWMRVSGMKG